MKKRLVDIWHYLVGGQRVVAQDRLAMQIADKYGLTADYKVARRHNMSPLEALEDWDLIDEADREKLMRLEDEENS